MTWKRNEVFSAIFARTGNSKRKRFAKRENKDRIMGSWENDMLQFWLNHLLSSEEWNSKQMAGA